MDHPLDSLLIDHERLFERSPKDPEQLVPYMASKEVRIVGRGEPRRADEAGSSWKYPFGVNTNPDFVWKELFLRAIRLNPDLAIAFKGGQMILTCDSVNLERFYREIKTAIGKANAAYKSEREEVYTRVKQEMAKRELEARAKS